MAKIVKPLNATQIKQAKAKEKEYNLSDGDGLFLRIKPNGTKQWLFNYLKPYTKQRTNISIGKYPEVSLQLARDLRLKFRTQLATNIDPKSHRDAEEIEKKGELLNTFEVVTNDWFETKKKKVQPVTYNKIWQILNNHAIPYLGKIPITEIKPKVVIDTLTPLEKKGSHETVKRLCRTLNEIMRHAIAKGLIEVNYLADITKLFSAPKVTNMATIKPERLPDLVIALKSATIMKITRYLVEWQLHTMCRPAEAATAEWSEIDLDKKLWIIPASKMKKNKEHIVPLTDHTLSMLVELKKISGHRQYIFPSHRNPRSHANKQSANMAIKRMGFSGELVSHGLRALASTTLNEHGHDPELIEVCLAHVDKNSVRAAYNRSEYVEKRRDIMSWWSDKINLGRVEF